MIPNIEDIKFEIEKIHPQSDDIICVKMPEHNFDGVNVDIVNQLGKELKEIFQNIPVVIMSDQSSLITLNEKELKNLGLQKIETT